MPREIPSTILDYIYYNHSNSSELLPYSSSEKSNLFFLKMDVDTIFRKLYTKKSYNEDASDKATKFYKVNLYDEKINYWYDDNWDI